MSGDLWLTNQIRQIRRSTVMKKPAIKLPALDEPGPRNDSVNTTGENGRRKTRGRSLFVRPAGNGLPVSCTVHCRSYWWDRGLSGCMTSFDLHE